MCFTQLLFHICIWLMHFTRYSLNPNFTDMRNILSIIFLFNLAVVNIALGQNSIQVNPKIREVTVYLSGAEVRFSETIALKRGENVILFKGLSPSLVEKSVQITVGNNVE